MLNPRHLITFCLALSLHACTTAAEPSDDDPANGDPPNGEPPIDSTFDLAVSPDDPHYLQAYGGNPLFLLGFGHPLDWYHPTRFADLQSAYVDHKLSFLRMLLPWAGPDADLVAYTHERTGPGTALDGGLKFDLTKIDPAFLDRLEHVVSWANEHQIVVAVGLWHDSPFEMESFGSSTDYNWQGSVINPSNRVNTEAAEVVVRTAGRPDFYDILGLQGGCVNGNCWSSQTDREWLRDRVKEVYDAILQRLEPYENWYLEIGSRAYFFQNSKRYWINYVRGTTNPFDDGAASAYAKADVLIIDQPTEPPGFYFVGEPDLVQQFTRPESGSGGGLAVNESFTEVNNWNGVDRILYDMNVVLMATPEGSPFNPDDRANRRRSAWQALLGGGHYDSMHDNTFPFGQTPSAVSYLADFEALMGFVRAGRGGTTIERRLIHMRPDNSRIVSTRNIATGPFALVHKTGEAEGYLVFANAGADPIVNVMSAGLTIMRLDTVTGTEDVDPGSPTTAGNNQLTGTGSDTVWWIAGTTSPAPTH